MPRNSLTRCTARHLRFRRLVQFIFAGPVSNNALKNCAALLCRTCADSPICVAVRYLTLRTGFERHGRKNPLSFPFSKRSPLSDFRRANKQGKGRSSKRKENRRLSFLFAPAAGRGTLPPQRRRIPPLRFSGKLSAPLGRTRLRQFVCPAQPVQEKEPPRQDEHACAVRAPRSVGAEKEPPRQGEHADAVRAPRSAGAGKEPPVRGEPADAVRAPRSAGAGKGAAR